jgi:hypothetical protein
VNMMTDLTELTMGLKPSKLDSNNLLVGRTERLETLEKATESMQIDEDSAGENSWEYPTLVD